MPEEDLVDCVKDNVESLGLSRSREDAQFRNKRRRRIKGGNQLSPVHLEKNFYIWELVNHGAL